MGTTPVINDDLFLAAVVATAHVGARHCQGLLKIARDDPGQGRVTWAEEMAAHLRGTGVACTHYVDIGERVPDRYWEAAACGRWCMVHVLWPGEDGVPVWALLDACYDHPRRLLRVSEGEPRYRECVPEDAIWLGHIVVMMDGPLPLPHEDRAMPSQN